MAGLSSTLTEHGLRVVATAWTPQAEGWRWPAIGGGRAGGHRFCAAATAQPATDRAGIGRRSPDRYRVSGEPDGVSRALRFGPARMTRPRIRQSRPGRCDPRRHGGAQDKALSCSARWQSRLVNESKPLAISWPHTPGRGAAVRPAADAPRMAGAQADRRRQDEQVGCAHRPAHRGGYGSYPRLQDPEQAGNAEPIRRSQPDDPASRREGLTRFCASTAAPGRGCVSSWRPDAAEQRVRNVHPPIWPHRCDGAGAGTDQTLASRDGDVRRIRRARPGRSSGRVLLVGFPPFCLSALEPALPEGGRGVQRAVPGRSSSTTLRGSDPDLVWSTSPIWTSQSSAR